MTGKRVCVCVCVCVCVSCMYLFVIHTRTNAVYPTAWQIFENFLLLMDYSDQSWGQYVTHAFSLLSSEAHVVFLSV